MIVIDSKYPLVELALTELYQTCLEIVFALHFYWLQSNRPPKAQLKCVRTSYQPQYVHMYYKTHRSILESALKTYEFRVGDIKSKER